MPRSGLFQDPIENAINLALTKANGISKRAAMGWALLDQCNSLLNYGGVMLGMSTDSLINSIERYQDELAHLILTIEPESGFCDQEALFQHIEQSHCRKITIVHRYHESERNELWYQWARGWPGEVAFGNHSYVAENLAAGARKMALQQRPWVTAVSASTIENQPLHLSDLINEFGFQAYLGNLVKHSRAILINHTQNTLISQLPKVNNGGESVEVFEVEEVAPSRRLLDNFYKQNKYSVLLICDPNQLSQYAENNLVDEIYHHIAIAHSNTISQSSAPELLKLKNWIIMSSEVAGNCTRIHIKNNKNIVDRSDYLRKRLN